ncbi:hypothetical protein AB3K78_09605 [Leucobacter sp. HNU]|uniref:hypothetical protein n=1 Tax=Leucobacter sp. HNU TaxID=3236805 RepID=UPI003A80532D
MTWQEEKAKTQATMRDIVAQVPQGVLVQAEVKGTGTLFGCNQTGPNGEKLHSWTGSATVTVKPGTDVESIVKAIELHYRESRFDVENDRGVFGEYYMQMSPSENNSSFIVSKDSSSQVGVLSWSECFQLPEGLYPGGIF